jgi:hypothetical protein
MHVYKVVRITPTNQSFLFATIFIRKEDEAAYDWVLWTLFRRFI